MYLGFSCEDIANYLISVLDTNFNENLIAADPLFRYISVEVSEDGENAALLEIGR